MLTQDRTGQAFRPGLSLVELPGIEPALNNALNWGHAGFDDGEITPGDAQSPAEAWQLLAASTPLFDCCNVGGR